MKTQTAYQGRQKVVVQTFDTLSVPHCVSTRKGGLSVDDCAEMNVGFTDHDSQESVIANRKLVCAAAMIDGRRFAFMEQVHGAEVEVIRTDDADTIDSAVARPGVDALICSVPGVTLMAKSADCPLVLIHDESTPAIAVIHSGRRGTLANVVENTIKTMTETFGSDPSNMVAGISPAISFKRYEVGAEFVESFKKAFPEMPSQCHAIEAEKANGRLDLSSIVQWQLGQCGVNRVEHADACTYERFDLFYSYRRDGATTGRFGVFAQLLS